MLIVEILRRFNENEAKLVSKWRGRRVGEFLQTGDVTLNKRGQKSVEDKTSAELQLNMC